MKTKMLLGLDDEKYFSTLFGYKREIFYTNGFEKFNSRYWIPVLEKSFEFIKINQLNKAIELIESYLTSNDSFTLWKAKAYMHLQTLNHEQAIISFENCLKIGLDDYTVYAKLGNSYNALNHSKNAFTAYSIAIDIKNRIVSSGDIDNTNEYEISIFKNSIPFEDLYANRAAASCAMNDFEATILDCDTADQYNPNYQVTNVVRAIMYHSLNKKAEFLHYINIAIENNYKPAIDIYKANIDSFE